MELDHRDEETNWIFKTRREMANHMSSLQSPSHQVLALGIKIVKEPSTPFFIKHHIDDMLLLVRSI